MDSAQLLQDAIAALQNVLTTRYISAAGYVLLLYDHLLTLDDEVEYIWKGPNTIAKMLFLLMRYLVPLFLTGQTVTRSGLTVIVMTDLTCKAWTAFSTYMGWLSVVISNFLVLNRIWSTLPRGHILISWSFRFFIVMQLASLGVTTWVVSNMISVLIFETTFGLCTFSSKPNLVGLWIPGLVFEIVVFGAVYWNVLDRPRAIGSDADPNARISYTLFRDGVGYFVILTGLRVANTVMAAIAPISAIFIVVFFIWGGVTLTTSRLIINSHRETAQAGKLWELPMDELEGYAHTDSQLGTNTASSPAVHTPPVPRRNASWSKAPVDC